MGLAKEPVPKPNEYLKAHEKEFKLPEKEYVTKKSKDELIKRPEVPDQTKNRPLLGIKTNKNFISQNAVDTIMAVPKNPERTMVDTRKGDKFPLETSGLVPLYVKKKVNNFFLDLRYNV
jgi:hypothetical protein